MTERRAGGRDAVAIILAIGLATAVNLLLLGVVWDAVRSDTPGLSENATQVIIAAFTGITGVLGGYVGGRAVEAGRRQAVEEAAARRATPAGETTPEGYPSDSD